MNGCKGSGLKCDMNCINGEKRAVKKEHVEFS